MNLGLILYIGISFSNKCENILIDDNGVEFLKGAINDYNNAINYFKRKAEVKSNNAINYFKRKTEVKNI